MANKYLWLRILVIVLVFGFMVVGCDEPNENKAPVAPGFSLRKDFEGGIRVIAYSPNATRYAIYWNDTSVRDAGRWEAVTANDLGSGEYLFKNLVPNRIYYFWVRAGNSYGNSEIVGPQSAEATVW